jgi:hypothetical protein
MRVCMCVYVHVYVYTVSWSVVERWSLYLRGVIFSVTLFPLFIFPSVCHPFLIFLFFLLFLLLDQFYFCMFCVILCIYVHAFF